ncbi:uncharacterized protein LOC143041223 [Oratosquilla oratoria]|uniref:uncharacterized protein LOC143041223 n=1 Tax=Oratosquilla oratoria TaxID=337810 RepID=UPI003F76525B
MESMCTRDSSVSPPSPALPSVIAPVALKPPQASAAAAAALEQYRLQLYNLAIAERLRLASSLAWGASTAAGPRPGLPGSNPQSGNPGPAPSELCTSGPLPFGPFGSPLATFSHLGPHPTPYSHPLYPYRLDPRLYRVPEEPKPQHSYIGLIAKAILTSPDKKMVLSDIYQYILDNFSYFRTRGPGWRNSIRHNLSLNDCFIKAGRSANGKGHYWAIHPANMEDFKKGDFRRRKAQRRVRKHMGLAVEDDSSPSPPHSPPPQPPPSSAPYHTLPAVVARKRQFDVASLLAPDDHPGGPGDKLVKTSDTEIDVITDDSSEVDATAPTDSDHDGIISAGMPDGAPPPPPRASPTSLPPLQLQLPPQQRPQVSPASLGSSFGKDDDDEGKVDEDPEANDTAWPLLGWTRAMGRCGVAIPPWAAIPMAKPPSPPPPPTTTKGSSMADAPREAQSASPPPPPPMRSPHAAKDLIKGLCVAVDTTRPNGALGACGTKTFLLQDLSSSVVKRLEFLLIFIHCNEIFMNIQVVYNFNASSKKTICSNTCAKSSEERGMEIREDAPRFSDLLLLTSQYRRGRSTDIEASEVLLHHTFPFSAGTSSGSFAHHTTEANTDLRYITSDYHYIVIDSSHVSRGTEAGFYPKEHSSLTCPLPVET